MAEYWWLIAIPVLVLVVAPLTSAAFEWRALKSPRQVESQDGMASASANPNITADFVWVGILLTAFLILFYLRS